MTRKLRKVSRNVYRTVNHLPQAIDLIKQVLNIWCCCYFSISPGFFLHLFFYALEVWFLFFLYKEEQNLETLRNIETEFLLKKKF